MYLFYLHSRLLFSAKPSKTDVRFGAQLLVSCLHSVRRTRAKLRGIVERNFNVGLGPCTSFENLPARICYQGTIGI